MKYSDDHLLNMKFDYLQVVDAKSYRHKQSLLTLNFQKMKTKKMSLANVQGKLSRAEMKNVMAGCGWNCGSNFSCSYNQGNQDPCVAVNMGTCTKNDGTWGCCTGR